MAERTKGFGPLTESGHLPRIYFPINDNGDWCAKIARSIEQIYLRLLVKRNNFHRDLEPRFLTFRGQIFDISRIVERMQSRFYLIIDKK